MTLALGIGANLTMFSLMRAVLWRPLPYPEPDRIVSIQVDARNVPNAGATGRELLGIRERSRSFEQVSAIDTDNESLEYAGELEHVESASVSDDFLPLLGVRPALGRTLDTSSDENAGTPLSILISDELWRRRFFADPGVIGRGVRLNGLDVQIAGVLPTGFRLFLPPSVNDLEQVDVWLPYRLDPSRPYRGIPVLARLRPGVTLDQANAELATLEAQFEREFPDFYSGARAWQASPSDRGSGAVVHFTARRLHDDMTRGVRTALFLLSGVVAFVLLIACVNAANLMLARGSARAREFEIRRALGAGRSRIVRQLLSESLVLALASAAVGLLCAHHGLKAIGSLSASHIPLQSGIQMDALVTLFALALSAVTTILFGFVPAWRLASGKTDHLLHAGRTQTAGYGARRLQRTLVVAEIALSIVPLACAGLILRSFLNLMHSPLGFNPTGVITARLPIDARRFPHREQRWALLRNIIDRLRAIPRVEFASAADPLPLAGQQKRRVGRADQFDVPPILATQQIALPGYLGAIGTPLLAGRDFTDEDIAVQRNVTIIDQRLAQRLWPEGALGKRLSIFRTGRRDDLEVVGVTAPVRTTRVRDENIAHFMMPYSDYPQEMALVIKTRQPVEQMATQIQSAVEASNPGRAVFNIRPMAAYISDSVGDTRFILLVMAAFAGASLLLAAVGLYGTLAYLSAQRSQEFGIRLALGSTASGLVAIVMRESILLAAAGGAAGLLGVVAVTRAIRELLYGVRPFDALTLLGAVALVGLVALAAAGVPAWRAARIDPQSSLRSE